ncbi:hypothetical protein [Halalkalibacter krulwichiae]|uniref:Uncharacterized protein n=1 Tax=Halalkalibacter krulwichiae TaxID=199441 RepID=A0A1X9M8V9_9BACI|nr:hypothetical protein [Halalkalibacter krulwichiae]ARK29050.1 hypothetical protein BkAM31D_03850 [Halalkalibacter krulwichiae]
MKAELEAVEKIKDTFSEDDYKSMVAKIAIRYLKDDAKNRVDLYKKVNELLKEKGLGSVSYSFVRYYEN